MKGTICVLLLVMACAVIQAKRGKQRHRRAAEKFEELQINHDLVRTKRKSNDPALIRTKRLEGPEPVLNRMKRTKRSLRHHLKEKSLHRMKRVPKEDTLHRAKRVRAEKTLRRIKRLRRDLRTQLLRHRRNSNSKARPLKIPIMKRGHGRRMSRTRQDKRSEARLNRMKDAIGKHFQQRKRNRFMHNKMNGVAHKKTDAMRKKNKAAQKKIVMKAKSSKSDKSHHVQAHTN